MKLTQNVRRRSSLSHQSLGGGNVRFAPGCPSTLCKPSIWQRRTARDVLIDARENHRCCASKWLSSSQHCACASDTWRLSS